MTINFFLRLVNIGARTRSQMTNTGGLTKVYLKCRALLSPMIGDNLDGLIM